jgi:hypothetical protein
MVVQPLVVSRFARSPDLDNLAGEAEIGAPSTPAAPFALEPPSKSQRQREPSTRALEEHDVSDPEKVAAKHRPLMAEKSVTPEYGGPKGALGEEFLLPEFNEPQRAVPAASPDRWTKPPESSAKMATPEPLLVPRPPRSESSPPMAAMESGDYVDQDLSVREEAPDFQVTARSSRHIGVRLGPGKMAAPYRQPHPEDPSYGTLGRGAEPPPVQVTIGRVEVRAILEAPPQPRSVPPSSPRVSLETYLRQGKEGRR